MIDFRQLLGFWVLLALSGGIELLAYSQTNPPALVPALDAATYQRVVNENLDLRREQERLTRESTDLRRRNASLVLQVQEFERKLETLTAAMAGMQAPDELKAEVERLRRDRDTLSREVERIRSEAQTSRQGNVAAGIPAIAPEMPLPTSDLYRKLERENGELRDQLAKARESTQNETQARAASTLHEARLQAQVDELTREAESRRRELDQAVHREKRLTSALVKVARKAQAYEAELKAVAATTSAPPAKATVAVAPVKRTLVEPTLLETGRKAIAAGRYADAEKLYMGGLERDPGNAALAYNLGVLYDDYLQSPRKAAVYYRKYLSLNPKAPDAALVRSWLLELDKKSDW